MILEAPYHTLHAEGPQNSSAYWINTSDEVRLRVAIMRPADVSKGTILLFPGRSEYVENYGRTAAELGKYGFATFAIDWRGQGMSDRLTNNREVGHVNSFADYQKDVTSMIEAANELDLPKPWYLIGHSMGACIGLRSITNDLPISACAFTSPMWDIKMSALERTAAWPLSWLAKVIGKGHTYVPGVARQTYVLSSSFENNKMTHDPDMYQYWIKQAEALPELTIGGPSMEWLFEALKECRRLSKLPCPTIPCISFCAEIDKDINVQAIQNRMEVWQDGSYELVESAKHELFLETPEIRDTIIRKIAELFSA